VRWYRLRVRLWRLAVRWLCPYRPRRGDFTGHVALIAECRRRRLDPKAATVDRSALGVPAQLEYRLQGEIDACR
jgi:hypothetical protein